MYSSLSIRSAGIEDVKTIGFLAHTIWPATYKEILSSGQLDYMMKLIYSTASLSRQILELKHSFLILEDDEAPVGFASYSSLSDQNLYKLHKIYVLPNLQGRGLGKLMIDYIVEKIRSCGAVALQLNVNRYNQARRFYEKLGFRVIREEDIDIGQGFFMNDYVMELQV
jgi:ribosomal protein S18 acetylase RimI-like enzyme